MQSSFYYFGLTNDSADPEWQETVCPQGIGQLPCWSGGMNAVTSTYVKCINMTTSVVVITIEQVALILPGIFVMVY